MYNYECKRLIRNLLLRLSLNFTSSKESTPACVGINRIWVLPEARRKSVATRLLDAVRSSLIYGTIVEKNQVAFTDPTPDGRRLAAKYVEREDFLVYNL